MERVIMKYVDKDNKGICLLIGDDNDELYVANLDEMNIYGLTPMGSIFDVLESIDFDEDDYYVCKDDAEHFKEFLKENADEIDSGLMFRLLTQMQVE